MPARSRQVLKKARHPRRRAVVFADCGTASLGPRGRARMGELAQVLARRVVRGAPLLQVAREQGLQDAHPGAALEVPRLYGMRGMPRDAPEARCAALEARRPV